MLWLCYCCLFSAIVYNLGMKVSDQVRTGEGHCQVCAARGRGAASSVCTRVIDTSQTLSLALIGCTQLGAVDFCKSNYSHWAESQSLTCIIFYCQIMMTIKANITQKKLQIIATVCCCIFYLLCYK